MSVYVDQLFTTPRSRRWRHDSACHLMADTLAELHAFAARIGLKRCWFQGDHYDLTEGRRAAAVQAGAVEVTARQLVEVRRKLRSVVAEQRL